MRGARFLLFALLLGACAARTPFIATAAAESSGDWQITKEIDSVTGAKLVSILIYSHKLSHSGLYFAGRSAMQFACLRGQPSIQFVFGFQIGSKTDSETSYRFDEQPEQPVEVHILRGLSVAVIEDKKEVAQFLKELASANVLYVVINSVAKGRTSAEFRVAGAQTPIDLLAANCPAKKKM